MKKIGALAAAIIISQAAGLLAVPFTASSVQTWYIELQKPFFNPPNWIFGPVWTLLYTLMGVAVYLVWVQGMRKPAVRSAVMLFGVQLFLNFIWSLLFFGLRMPALALIEIAVLWLAIVLTIQKFYPLSKKAAYLMIPYLAWVSFAALLNAAIVWLN